VVTICSLLYVTGFHLSLDISNIKERLSLKKAQFLPRQLIILAGYTVWQNDVLRDILLDYEQEPLWVADNKPKQLTENNDIPFVFINKAHSWLGNEKKLVIFDANKDFAADSFAAISGIVVGGGILFLLLPAEHKWSDVYASPFGRRLIENIQNTKEIVVINEADNKIDIPSLSALANTQNNIPAPFLTVDQQHAVEAMETEVVGNGKKPVVLISDRGRGKSAALGLLAARLLTSGIKNIAVTAPRLRATNILFKHIAECLQDAVVSRGSVTLNDASIQFYSPEQLITEGIKADLLLVDEAAAIPVPLLTSFLNQFPQCIFATTVHGYEGTGRGFSLRFYKVLDNFEPDWLKLQMKTPIRWPENDLLEKWMFSLLCLDADIVDSNLLTKTEVSDYEYKLVNKTQLIDNPIFLNEVFALLVLAHYRTKPSDLKNLLDNDDISVYTVTHDSHVIAVGLIIHEGGYSQELSSAVYKGERRPFGNLLAQSLTYHCGIENAATLAYARIMRIAVHPELQRQGIGTKLIRFIIDNEKNQNSDAIGVSFGMNAELLNFWDKLNFRVARVGFTKEQTSGEHAAILVQPFSPQGEHVSIEAHSRFNTQTPYWLNDLLQDLPETIKGRLQQVPDVAIDSAEFYIKDLQSFILYSRNYELCIAAINNFLTNKEQVIYQPTFPDDFRLVIDKKIKYKKDWKAIAAEMHLTGKNEARKLFHQAVCYLAELSD